jgi:flagellar motor switch protein FliN
MNGRPRELTYREHVLQIDATLSVTLARGRISLARVLELAPGVILPLAKRPGEPMELAAEGHTIASGEIVTLGNRFAIRLRDVAS